MLRNQLFLMHSRGTNNTDWAASPLLIGFSGMCTVEVVGHAPSMTRIFLWLHIFKKICVKVKAAVTLPFLVPFL